ncbi:zinc finger MYM-type protein 1-like [Aphis gossypii]|uniref:zinc finger MYM-type protein 1-like n=1 Tax=Aphis gossypii TaxID=80765 RepID=UPI0021597B8D|nr:zinc finger MYM-type protein 1-like [Aphis gossypii]
MDETVGEIDINTDKKILTELEINNDPALWPSMSETVREKCIQLGPAFFQNKNNGFSASLRDYKNQKSNSSMNPFVKNGFSNWKKGDERISGHENSSVHQVCTMKWLHRLNNKTNINKQLTKQLEVEENYWIDILKRVVEAIRFLSTRGLAFRGSHEVIGVTDNGNYLGILELIAKFDPVLKAHIENYGNKGRGSVSYISKTICEELIGIMSLKVFDHIVDEIIKSKYFGIVVDSTPDLAHIDQLSIIIRYCLNGMVHERFLGFVSFHSHTGEALATTVLEFLKRSGIDIANCRAQTYDNAANMSGRYHGLQAQIKDLNDLAFYVPCVAHSLNLVGDCSAKECLEAINYFSILQKLYAFFAASTHRWDVLLRNSKKSSKTLKSLSSTRWSCRNDAIEALADMNENADTRHDANSIKKKLIKLEIAFMTIFWKRVLGRFNATSVYLQRIEIDMVTGNSMLQSLITFVDELRNDFDAIEDEAKILSISVNKEWSNGGKNKRKIIKKYSDGTTGHESLKGRDTFRVNTFFVIIDKLQTELKKRSSAYDNITNLFGFLTRLDVIDDNLLKKSVNNLVKVYSRDLEESLYDELKQFIGMVKVKEDNKLIKNPINMLQMIVEDNLSGVFPHIYVAFRIFLSIPVTNCESERSFSALTIIKNKYRCMMGESRLTSLSILSIECELTMNISFENIIRQFAQEKSRKKFFKHNII